ncbi:hypothetical protein BaRGS_00019163 [Batillaria attramentaria]|uniref:Uncharacterized protein n=1 Tax=Batillaria attramentaria TaxID=370345 RepID=A0ABD0KQT3_9CAEN
MFLTSQFQYLLLVTYFTVCRTGHRKNPVTVLSQLKPHFMEHFASLDACEASPVFLCRHLIELHAFLKLIYSLLAEDKNRVCEKVEIMTEFHHVLHHITTTVGMVAGAVEANTTS